MLTLNEKKMNKFLCVPVVLGLVLGCAGFAAGNDNDEGPAERYRRVIEHHQEVSDQVMALIQQMHAKEQELRELGEQQNDNISQQVEILKCCKRELVLWEEGEEPHIPAAAHAEHRQKINNILTLLQDRGLYQIINKVNEYMEINVAWRSATNRLRVAQDERDMVLRELPEADQAF